MGVPFNIHILVTFMQSILGVRELIFKVIGLRGESYPMNVPTYMFKSQILNGHNPNEGLTQLNSTSPSWLTLGIHPFLLPNFIESDDPWYVTKKKTEESAKSNRKKQLMDPMNDMKHYLGTKRKCTDESSSQPIPEVLVCLV